MPSRFHIQVLLPADQKNWQPAMVRKIGGDPVVEVHRYKNRVRIVPGYEDDTRAQVLAWACRREGVEQACLCWADIWAEWRMRVEEQYQPGWMQDLRARAVRMTKAQRQSASR